jgi:hypothetical protein
MAKVGMRRRMFIEDARRNGVYLRTTWHEEAGQFVISTWNDDVCTGAVRVPAAEAPALIGMLADGLADAMAAAPEASAEGRAPRPRLLDRIRAWIRGRTKADEPVPVPGPIGLRSRKSA